MYVVCTNKRLISTVFLMWISLLVSVSAKEKDSNYGSFIGTLSNKEQGISGQLYSIDKNTVYLRNFTFTGTGSGEYFCKYVHTVILEYFNIKK